jgi:hypothetical protein
MKRADIWLGFWPGLLALLLSALGFAAGDPKAPVAMLTQVSGQVNLVAGATPPQPARAFGKLAPGTELRLADQAQVRLIYFQDGLQEHWQGPAHLRLGDAASIALNGQPSTSRLPEGVGGQLQRLNPDLQLQSMQRGGLTIAKAFNPAAPPVAAAPRPEVQAEVRASRPMAAAPKRAPETELRAAEAYEASVSPPLPGEPPMAAAIRPPTVPQLPQALRQAEENYKRMKSLARPDDWTPDLYWLGVLQEANEPELLKRHLQQTLQRFPELRQALRKAR